MNQKIPSIKKGRRHCKDKSKHIPPRNIPIEEIQKLRSEGLSYAKIGYLYNVSQMGIYNRLNKPNERK